MVLRLDLCLDGLRYRLVAEQTEDRVTGAQKHQRVDDQRRSEKDGDRLENAPPDVPPHSSSWNSWCHGIAATHFDSRTPGAAWCAAPGIAVMSYYFVSL
jgi:hypothetical protein